MPANQRPGLAVTDQWEASISEVSVANDVSRATIWSPVVRGDYHESTCVHSIIRGQPLEAPLIDNTDWTLENINPSLSSVKPWSCLQPDIKEERKMQREGSHFSPIRPQSRLNIIAHHINILLHLSFVPTNRHLWKLTRLPLECREIHFRIPNCAGRCCKNTVLKACIIRLCGGFVCVPCPQFSLSFVPGSGSWLCQFQSRESQSMFRREERGD